MDEHHARNLPAPEYRLPIRETSIPSKRKKTAAVASRTTSQALDATNLYWYRVQNYSISGTTATVTLDSPAIVDSNQIMFFRNVVQVYDLPPKTL